MTRIIITGIIATIFVNLTVAQSKPAYQLFKNDGEIANYEEMIDDLVKSDMVFFGEYHTNPISHWMQFEMSKLF